MNRREIKASVKKLNQEISKLENQIELLELQIKQIQRNCEHPNLRKYTDMAGDPSCYCPDCGYEN